MGHYTNLFRNALHAHVLYDPKIEQFFMENYITRLTYQPKELFSNKFQGGAQAISYFQKGMFKLYGLSSDGQEIFSGFIPRYSTLITLQNGSKIGKYLCANDDAIVYIAARDDYLNFITTNKELTWKQLNEPYYRRNANALPLYETMNLSSREKVYIYILYLGIRFGDTGKNSRLVMVHPPTLKDVANYNGVHPNSVSRYYNELRNQDLIEFSHKKLVIFDADALDKVIVSLKYTDNN